jgi:hypothetical protein
MPDAACSHTDPLIDEVRERRRQLLVSCGNSLRELGKAIQRRQAEHPEKVVAPRRQRRSPAAQA